MTQLLDIYSVQPTYNEPRTTRTFPPLNKHTTGHDPVLVLVSVLHGGIKTRATTTADV